MAIGKAEAQVARLEKAWERPHGWHYFSDVNNSVVGIWYIVAAFGFLMFGGVLGLLIRAQLAVPENDLMSSATYSQVFTLHGTVMMFLFAVPIFEAVAIVILPAMLGARDLPFPRLSAFRLLVLRHWRGVSLRLDLFWRSTGCWLVHVSPPFD